MSSGKLSSGLNWLGNQFSMPAVIKTTLVLGIFGFIPGAWLYGVPLLFGYGLIKQKSISKAVNEFTKGTAKFWNNLSTWMGNKAGETLNSNPADLFIGTCKILATIVLLYSDLNIWNLMAIYGMYRFSDKEWFDHFKKWTNSCYNFFAGFFTAAGRDRKFYKNMGMLVTFTIFAAWLVSTASLAPLVSIGLGMLQISAISVGMSAVFRDLNALLNNPLKIGMQNSGKIAGVWWGRELAYTLFSGRIDGNLGPAVGEVINQGVFSSFLSSLFSPKGWFILNDSLLGHIAKRVLGVVNGLVSGFLFTSHMQMNGSFIGTIGPGTEQLFFFMLLGGLVGYGIERFVDTLCDSVSKDAVIAKNSMRENAYRARWHVGFTALATPAILLSPGAPAILEIAGGSMAAAAGLTVGGIATSFVAIYVVGYSLKRLRQHLLGSNELEKNPAQNGKPPLAKNDGKSLPKPQDKLKEDKQKIITHRYNLRKQKNTEELFPIYHNISSSKRRLVA